MQEISRIFRKASLAQEGKEEGLFCAGSMTAHRTHNWGLKEVPIGHGLAWKSCRKIQGNGGFVEICSFLS